MKIYAKLDYLGKSSGYWPVDVFPDREDGARHPDVPATATPISLADYRTLVSDETKAYLGGHIVDYVPPPVEPGPVVVPESITRRQFLLALYGYSETVYNQIVEFVHNHDYPPVAIEFDNALYFYRYSNTLQAVAADPSLNFNDEQIDAVFIAGALIAD